MSVCSGEAGLSLAHASSGAEQHKPNATQRERKNRGNFLSMFFPYDRPAPSVKPLARAGLTFNPHIRAAYARQTHSGGNAVRRLPHCLSVSGCMPLRFVYYSDLAAGALARPPACSCNSFSVFTTGKLGLVPGSCQPPPRAMHTLTTLSSLSRNEVASCNSAAKS